MPVSDSEPRFQFVDANGDVVASFYWDSSVDAIKAAFDDGTETTVAEQ